MPAMDMHKNYQNLTLWPLSGRFSTRLTFQRGWDNLWGQMEEVSQVLDTLIGQVPIVVTPSKLLLHITTRFQRLKYEHDIMINFGISTIHSTKV